MTWPMVKLGDVASIDRRSVDPTALSEDTPYVGLENIESGGCIINVQKVPSGELKSNKFAFCNKHILYGKLRPYLAKIALPDFDGICSTDILPVRPSRRVDRSYLAHYLKQPSLVEFAASRAEGANLPRLSPTALAAFDIPLPPLAEQKRIAAILDEADQLRRKRRRAIELLDSLTQSIFLEMFGSPSSPYSTVPLAEVTHRITDGVHQKPTYTSGGVPFISVKDITTGYIKFDDCKFISREDHLKYTRRVRPEEGDILYTKVGATYGRPSLVDTDREFSIYVSVALIKPDKMRVRPKYLKALMATELVKSQADRCIKGIGVPDLHLDQIQGFRVPLPPLMEQVAFERIVDSVELRAGIGRRALEKLDAAFASLQHRAFTGQL